MDNFTESESYFKLKNLQHFVSMKINTNMVDCDLRELAKIFFGIQSAEEIKREAVVEITSSKLSFDDSSSLLSTVYDPRLGSIKNGVECDTCKLDGSECPGHMGYIELNKPVIHPVFLQHVVMLLKCFCRSCYKFILDRERLELRGLFAFKGKRRFSVLMENLKKFNICFHCEQGQPEYRLISEDNFQVIYAIYENSKIIITAEECLVRFQNIDDETVELLGFDPKLVHPKNCILTRFPVLPICCRPYVISDGNICDDDLTYQLIEIVKNNALVNDIKKGAKYYSNLLFRIQTYFNNSQKKAKHATTGRPIKGIKERIAGKEGQIRNNLLGKRTNQSGRTVIGPDPFIDMETVVVPKQMADILTIPEYIYDRNIHLMYELLENDQINYIIKKDGRKINVSNLKTKFLLKHGDRIAFPDGREEIVQDTRMQLENGCKVFRNGKETELEQVLETGIELGDTVYRKLQDGDYVMLNRQPTLHKASMMALKVKILPIKTLKINLAISKPFNCDFDGDEMNIHVPQSLESRIELEQLSISSQCLINSQMGKPNMCIVQDTLTAAYLLTKNANVKLNRSNFFHIISRVHKFSKLLNKLQYYNVDVINYILPDITFSDENVEIKNGVLIRGILNKKYLGASHSSLVKIIHHQCGVRQCVDFINNLQLVCNEWLLLFGFTIHAGDCLRTKSDNDNDLVLQCFQEAESHRMNIKHPRIREGKIISCLSKAKDIGMKIARDALKLDNNFITTVESGSKGDYFNIAQITGLLGQQTIINGRIQGVMNNKKRSLPHFPLNVQLTIEDEYKSKGFITSSFEKGLDPLEFFYHSMSGRKGVSDTAMSTATSGYNMRRIVKLTEDITVQYDGTVRDVNKRYYQIAYNELGYDPTKLFNNQICNVQQIIDSVV